MDEDDLDISFGTFGDDDHDGGPVQEHGPRLGQAAPADESGTHALQTSWRFWYEAAAPKSEGSRTRGQIAPFRTVEAFWKQHGHLRPPSRLGPGVSLFMFRDPNFTPASPALASHARWDWSAPRQDKAAAVASDRIWDTVMLFAIGEEACEPSLCGVALFTTATEDRISVRRADDKNDLCCPLTLRTASLRPCPGVQHKSGAQPGDPEPNRVSSLFASSLPPWRLTSARALL